MQRNTRQRLLDLIVARLGVPKVARYLDVGDSVVDAWSAGSVPIPDDKLVGIVDLIEASALS